MTTKLQNKAWSVLPKEFKEEVKKRYNDVLFTEYDRGYEDAIIYIFGYHNLTSDAEGEEMLMVKRSEVIRMYSKFVEEFEHSNPKEYKKTYYDGRINALLCLFGSKCLPDNVDNLVPKFRKGDKVCVPGIEKYSGQTLTVSDCRNSEQGWIYEIQPNKWINEAWLEPYTEPKDESRNLSQETANCDKEFDNILKDSFSKERRLNIAALMAQAILTRIDDTPQVIAEAAFRHADALIAECGKGGRV